MAWNGKRPLKSTRKSLLNPFDFFEKAIILRVQYPGEYPRLNHCDRFSCYCASLAEERKKERKKERSRLIRPTPPVCRSTCLCGTPAKLCTNANSLVAVENTRDVMEWLIKAYDCNQSRVLNV